MRNLKTLLVIASSSFLLSCSKDVAKAPHVTMCSILSAKQKLVCVDTQGKDKPDVLLADADSYVAFSPDDWALITSYIAELKNKAKGRLKPEQVLRLDAFLSFHQKQEALHSRE